MKEPYMRIARRRCECGIRLWYAYRRNTIVGRSPYLTRAIAKAIPYWLRIRD